MARIFIDGFESGGLGLWTTLSGTPAVVSSSGQNMSGSYLLSCYQTGNDDGARVQLPSSKSQIYLAFKYRAKNGTWSQAICSFYDSAGTIIATIRRNSSALLYVQLGNKDGTVLATGTTTVTNDVTYLIEVYYKPLNSSGNVILKINGAQDFTYSGDTTIGLENVFLVSVGRNEGFNYGACYIDDFIIDDSDWIGATYIQALVPTGAGNSTQWDPSTGSNYDCVNEIPYSDSDYISTNVVNEIDTYVVGNLSGSIQVVKSVSIMARCSYQGSPIPTKQDLVIRSGGTDYPSGTTISPELSFSSYYRLWGSNPAGGAWDETSVNAIEIGVKAVA